MRFTGCLLAALLLAPSFASAQVFIPGPPPPPHVYIQGRIQWHVRRHAPPPVYYSPLPPPVWVAPAAPPPPVYVAPPPVVIQPQQQYYVVPQPIYQPPYGAAPPPAVVAPMPVAAKAAPPKPQWGSRFGLGATAEGVFGRGDESSKGFGVLGQLRYRTSRHTALELMGGYERSTVADTFTRSDIPFTFGLLIPFLGPEHVLSPYVVLAAGLNYADLRLVESPGYEVDDKRVQAIGQVGGGLELRLGQHFALNADARLEGRWNLDGPSDSVANATVKVAGNTVGSVQNSAAVRIGVGGTVYF